MSINLFLIVMIIVLGCKIASGHKRGMVREVISFLSLIVECIVVVLLGNGIHSYLEGEFLGVAAAVLLLAVLGIVHHLAGLVLFPAKMVSKLPIVHWLDKLLGVVAGILETVVILWTIYTLIMLFDTGMIGQQILLYTEESSILSWFYQHNYLAAWVRQFAANIN